MALSRARQGKTSSIYVDEINASPFISEYKFESKRDDTDVTPIEADDKIFQSGTAENTCTLTGFWNGDADSLDELLDDTFGGDVQNIISIMPAGCVQGNGAYLASATQVKYNIKAKSSEQVEGESEFRSARVRARVLKARGLVSTTGVGTSGSTGVMAPAATSKGATLHVHVMALTGAPTACVISVEGSADGTSFTALSTPLSVDIVGGANGYIATTLKSLTIPKYLQVRHTITGGTTPSLDYIALVGRRAI